MKNSSQIKQQKKAIAEDSNGKKIVSKIESLTLPKEDKDRLIQRLTSGSVPGGGDNFCFGGFTYTDVSKNA